MKRPKGINPRLVIVVAAVITLAAILAIAPRQRGFDVSEPVRLSSLSPLRSCALSGPGINYQDAAVEPWISAQAGTLFGSPTLVVVWQQDRWSTGGAAGIMAASSDDGGRTWMRSALPLTSCLAPALPYDRATDPWVSVGRDGTVYVAVVGLRIPGPEFFPNNSAIITTTSVDGGITWSPGTVIYADSDSARFLNDKVTITADPRAGGVAYVSWQRLDAEGEYFSMSTWFSMTADYGRSWAAPRPILEPGWFDEAFSNQLLVDPRDGALYHVFNWIKRSGDPQLDWPVDWVALRKSTDRGMSWSDHRVLATLEAVGVFVPHTGEQIRTGHRMVRPAVDANTGALYVAWQDSRFNGALFDEIVISRSNDGGFTWSEPMRVNASAGTAAFTPAIHAHNGLVGVSYYQLRDVAEGGPSVPADYWIAISRDGGTSFDRVLHLGGPFDLRSAPNVGGPFLGDYHGLAGSGDTLWPVFARPVEARAAQSEVVAVTVQR